MDWTAAEDAFRRLFETRGDPAVEAELLRLGLTPLQIETGVMAGLVQMAVDGEGLPGTEEAFRNFKMELPSIADIILKSLQMPERNVQSE